MEQDKITLSQLINFLFMAVDILWGKIGTSSGEGTAKVLSQCKEPWVREAIEESFIDDGVKAELLK